MCGSSSAHSGQPLTPRRGSRLTSGGCGIGSCGCGCGCGCGCPREPIIANIISYCCSCWMRCCSCWIRCCSICRISSSITSPGIAVCGRLPSGRGPAWTGVVRGTAPVGRTRCGRASPAVCAVPRPAAVESPSATPGRGLLCASGHKPGSGGVGTGTLHLTIGGTCAADWGLLLESLDSLAGSDRPSGSEEDEPTAVSLPTSVW